MNNNNSTTNFIPVTPPSQENKNTRNPRTNRLNLDSNNTNQLTEDQNQSQTNQNVVSFGGESLSREDYMHDDDIDRKYPHSHVIDYVIDEKDINHDFKCIICLEQFKIEEKSLKLICGHIFHKECLDPWLKNHNTCPICRQTIIRNNPSIFPTPNHSRQITIPFSVSSNRNRTFFGQSSLWSSRNRFQQNPQLNVPYQQHYNYNYQSPPRPNTGIYPPSQNEPLVDGPCTYNRTHNHYVRQPFYDCVTCGLVNGLGCCEACAKICHRGHQLVYRGVLESFCDCGEGKTHSCVHCKCLKVPANQAPYVNQQHHNYNYQSPPRPTTSIYPPSQNEPLVDGPCTYNRTHNHYVRQPFYDCVTCGLVNGLGCCEACAKICHRGHQLVYRGVLESFCDCGEGKTHSCVHCKCLKVPANQAPYVNQNAQQTSTCTFVRTGRNMVEQNLYTCVTCHFRLNQCICESCAKVCHHGHDLRCIGKCIGFCDCGAGELGMRCKCMIGEPDQFSG